MDLIPTDRTAGTPISRPTYDEYMGSRAWIDRRTRALNLARWRCNRCGSAKRLQVHHKTYERLGRELDADLEVVCKSCHEAHHIEEHERTEAPLPLYVKLVFESLREEAFTSMANLAEQVKCKCAALRIPYSPNAIAKAIHQASVALPKTSRFHSARPVPIDSKPPAELYREINRTEAVEILDEVRRRADLVHALKGDAPVIEKAPIAVAFIPFTRPTGGSMRTWTRAIARLSCGNCNEEIAKGDPVLEISFGRIVKKRCGKCEGPPPPDLPPLIEQFKPEAEFASVRGIATTARYLGSIK